MAIIRAAHERDFTIITNAALRDTNLSLKAKGLLALMLSEHDGWNFTIKGLSTKCKEGVDAIAAIVKELEAQAMWCAAVNAAPPATLPRRPTPSTRSRYGKHQNRKSPYWINPQRTNRPRFRRHRKIPCKEVPSFPKPSSPNPA